MKNAPFSSDTWEHRPRILGYFTKRTCCVNKWHKMPTDQRVTASKVIQWQNHFSDSKISCNDSYHYQLCCFVSPCLMLGNYNHLAWHLYTSSMDSMYTGLNYQRSQYLDYEHWQAFGSNTQHWQGSIFLCWLENCQFLLTAQATLFQYNCLFFPPCTKHTIFCTDNLLLLTSAGCNINCCT